MVFERVVSMNEFVNGIEVFKFLFEETKPSFVFTVSLGVFHSCDDMLNVVFFEEIHE